MFAVAAALLALIALLATLQYKWLGRVSDAERKSMTETLELHSSAVAQDFDMEVTRAYATFQMEPAAAGENLASRLTQRYDRWLATARYPRLVRDIYIVPAAQGEKLQRFSGTTRFVEPVEWPAELLPIRDALAKQAAALAAPPRADTPGTFFVRGIPATVWEDVPALVIAMPMIFVNTIEPGARAIEQLRLGHLASFVVVHLDRDYITREMLPALIEQRFRAAGDAGYQLAVVSADGKHVVFTSDRRFVPAPGV